MMRSVCSFHAKATREGRAVGLCVMKKTQNVLLVQRISDQYVKNASKEKEKRPARPAQVKVPVSKTNTEKTKETREV